MNIKNFFVAALFATPVFISTSSAQAITLSLADYAINTDGVLQQGSPGLGDPMLAGLDIYGLGTISYTITGAGNHNFVSFFDFEFDQANNTFFNESGSANGALATGQSWEIDEPGWVFGDIYDNVLAGTLDNTNAVPAGSEDDVSFALGWNFDLTAGQSATITLVLSDILSTTGFYLQHTDAEVGANFDQTESVYFWSDLSITGGSVPVPESGSLALLGMGLLCLGLVRRRRLDIATEY